MFDDIFMVSGIFIIIIFLDFLSFDEKYLNDVPFQNIMYLKNIN